MITSIGDGMLKVLGKGRKERVVPIGRKALEAVDHYLNFRDAMADDQRQHLFVNRQGKPVSRILIWKAIKHYARLAGIVKNVSPHTLRHSFATHLVDNGAELRVIQEMLGHASISSTDRYTHISRTHLQEAFFAFHPRR
jgi:integrase/recombinase XerD